MLCSVLSFRLAFCLEGWPAWTMGRIHHLVLLDSTKGVCPRETSGQEATRVGIISTLFPSQCPQQRLLLLPATLPWSDFCRVLITSAPCREVGRGCHYFLCDDKTHVSLPVVLSQAHGFTNHTFIKLPSILQFTCLSDPPWGLWSYDFNYLFVCVPV